MATQKASATVLKDLGEKEISITTTYLMIGTALLFDLVSFLINLIPIIGQIISVFVGFIAYTIFFFWFIMKGVRLLTKKRLFSMGSGLLISLIPILNMLPEITTSVLLTIRSTKKKPGVRL